MYYVIIYYPFKLFFREWEHSHEILLCLSYRYYLSDICYYRDAKGYLEVLKFETLSMDHLAESLGVSLAVLIDALAHGAHVIL